LTHLAIYKNILYIQHM